MNTYVWNTVTFCDTIRFRPQQGLPIMNNMTNLEIVEKEVVEFPSPTGATYYESQCIL